MLKGVLTYLEKTDTQPAVIAFVSELPADPADGDRYILTEGADENKVAMFVKDAWRIYEPQPGWTVYVDGVGYEYYGTEWEEKKYARAHFDEVINNDFGRDRDFIFNLIKYFDYTFDETFE